MSWIWSSLSSVRWAWDNRKEITANLKMVRQWFNKPSRILIIGPGGTGKTTLAKILSGKFDWLVDEPWKYEQSLKSEKFAFKGRNIEALVAPGQKLSRSVTWDSLLKDLSGGKYHGVILVSSFGYHSIPSRGLTGLNTNKINRAAIEEFRKNSLIDELKVAHELSKAIESCPKRIWLLSVVSKEDLWWRSRQVVYKHYTAGEHGCIFSDLVNRMGTHGFTFEVSFSCLVIARLLTSKGDVLMKNVEGYDAQAQVTSLKELLQRIDALRIWENKS